MEKLERYRDLIKQQIRRYVESFSEGANSDVQELKVFDDERGTTNGFRWDGKMGNALSTHISMSGCVMGRFGLRKIQRKTA
jgi:hypothetical protein